MDKVVVIGGAGFLGSHIADVLSENGFHVVIFDNRKSPWLRNDQDMIIGDILDVDQVRNTISGSKYVYHFAGIADITESIKRPLDTIKLNVVGTSNAVQSNSTSPSANAACKPLVVAGITGFTSTVKYFPIILFFYFF